MKKLFALLICLMLAVPAFADSLKIRLPGSQQEIKLDGMSQHERNALLDYIEKNKKAASIDIPTDPEYLDKWRVLITKTIKDIASDLNVAVNDFIKTPAGLGVSALIIYKVAGADLLARVWNLLIVPYWFMSMTLIFCIAWFLFKPADNYKRKKEEITDGKVTAVRYYDTKRSTRYPFASDEARGCAMGFLGIAAVVNTIVSLVIFF